jgi:hypothetical protein
MPDYVDNEKFTKELGDWAKRVRTQIKNGEKPERMPEYIGECVYLICNNMRYSRFFIRYSQNENMIHEMIGDAIENCIRYAKNFDGDKFNNGFGYINRIAYFAFVRYIKKEKKRYINHLLYIRKTFSEDEIRSALDADSPNDVKYYTTYVDHMQSILDDMNIELPEAEVKERKIKKPKVNTNLVEDNEKGEEY